MSGTGAGTGAPGTIPHPQRVGQRLPPAVAGACPRRSWTDHQRKAAWHRGVVDFARRSP